MWFTLPVALCLLTLVGLTNPVLGQSQSITQSASSVVNDRGVALVRDKSGEDRERLLAQKKDLMNASLLAALKDQANAQIQKGEYVEAQRISHIAVRIAQGMGDRPALAAALCDLGSAYGRQMNRSTEALDYLQKSLTIFQEVGDKKGQARALQAIGVAYGLQAR